MAKTPSRQRQIFEAALALPVEQQLDYVHEACAGDSDLEQRVVRLIDAHRRETDIKSPVSAVVEDPEQIGPYRLLETVGEGGMGVVYVAEQLRPVRRRVAVKIIRAGMETKEVIARFESERQALAMMNHPNIARILDVGATERGRPYFVMEYVPGVSIVEYCDSKRLDIAERIALFQEACDAVQHAHQKGVIHRDLKPSNILVRELDGRPTPKIIDFGIAKATGQRLGDLTVHTRLGSFVGTPEYMSPEQAERTTLDIDTRADVYSLGAVLYELLVGAPPLRFGREMGPAEIQKMLVEKDPPAPSQRVQQAETSAHSWAAARATTIEQLTRSLSGDLDWVVLKALEKDRSRRYSAASELAADLGRHLDREPVSAGPPSAIYRMSKFAQRNRGPLLAALLVLIVLVGGIIGTSIGLIRAKAEAERARTQAAAAEQVTDFLVGLFEVSDPSEARGSTITAREILSEGTERISHELAEQPEVQAKLMDAMGRVYQSLGLYDTAQPLLEEALAIRREKLGATHPDVAQSLSNLGELSQLMGNYETAESRAREALELRRSMFGHQHPDVAISLDNLALALHYQGDHGAAEPLFREAVAMGTALLGNQHPDTGRFQNDLAVLLLDMGRYEEAEPLQREALRIHREHLGSDHPKVVNNLNDLALILRYQGRVEEAEELLREALALRRMLLGDEHPDVALSLNNLALLLMSEGGYEEAEPMLREALDMTRRLLSDDSPSLANYLNSLAVLLQNKGDCRQAEPLFKESLALHIETLGTEHWITAQVRSHLGACMTELGRYREAEELLLAGLAGLADGLGESHERTQKTRTRLVDLYDAWDRPEMADRYRATDEAGEAIALPASDD